MTESLEFRQPNPADAPAVSQLFLVRYDDIIPGRQSWKPRRMRYFETHGPGYFLDIIQRANDFPKANFACVAMDGDNLAGFACATADPSNKKLARLVGLVVDEDYQRHKIGTRLEIERQGWADLNDRVLYGQIVDESNSARSFYRSNGYQEVGTRAMAETVFRLIEHTPPNVPPLTMDVHWSEGLNEEPLVY